MGQDLKFSAIESNLNAIIGLVSKNQNIKRLLKYTSNTPLKVTPTQIDIESSLIDSQIIPDFFDYEITEVAETKLYIYFLKADFNSPTSIYRYGVDIVVPNTLWRLIGTGQWRYTQVFSEIEKMFDRQYITGIGQTEGKNSQAGRLKSTNYNFAHLELTCVNSTRGTTNYNV